MKMAEWKIEIEIASHVRVEYMLLVVVVLRWFRVESLYKFCFYFTVMDFRIFYKVFLMELQKKRENSRNLHNHNENFIYYTFGEEKMEIPQAKMSHKISEGNLILSFFL
jgi:hypothetical protein